MKTGHRSMRTGYGKIGKASSGVGGRMHRNDSKVYVCMGKEFVLTSEDYTPGITVTYPVGGDDCSVQVAYYGHNDFVVVHGNGFDSTSHRYEFLETAVAQACAAALNLYRAREKVRLFMDGLGNPEENSDGEEM